MRRQTFILACLFATTIAAAQSTRPLSRGLDSLREDRVISELANRGLTDLLDRAFDVNQYTPAQRAGIRALIALQDLSQLDANFSSAERRRLIAQVTAGIEQALPTLDEPQSMMRQAATLIRYGVERDVNILEYWGENPQTQQQLRPVVEAVIKLLERTEQIAHKQAEELANQLTGPADPRGKSWQEISTLTTNAAYTRHMLLYDLALTMPPGSQERLETADKAIDYLKQLDNSESTVQPTVRNRIAKLHMARGEFDQAREIFATVIAAKDLSPAPGPSQAYEARYFAAVCDVLTDNAAGAHEKLDALIQWQNANLPTDPTAREGADAATAMLRYRLASLEADKAADLAAKQQLIAAANSALIDLVKRRADLRPVIFEQLIRQLPPNPDLKSLDPLMLQAIIQRADNERLKPATENADKPALEQGIAAARELVSRRAGDIDAETRDAAAMLAPLFAERLGRDIDAAAGFLDYLRHVGTKTRNAPIALDAVRNIVARLRADPAHRDNPAIIAVYQQFLTIALQPPFQRNELAFEYARLLQSRGQLKDAADYFGLVPSTDPRLVTARYYQMAVTQQRLDEEKLNPADRATIVASFQRLADQVTGLAEASLANAKTPAEQSRYRTILARTALLSADVARREQNNPDRALTLLENIEQIAQGLPAERQLLANALYMRVQAYMTLGRSDDATNTLVKLLSTKSGGEGVAIVYELMQKLNQELTIATAAENRTQMAAIASNRSKLSGFLVEWARTNPNSEIRKYTYRYSVFDAAARHLAAQLNPDPAARAAQLQEALELYRKLQTPDAVAMYRATTQPSDASPDSDPQVALGIGLVSFDLGDYPEAQRRLGQLLTERKLGSPLITSQSSGEEHPAENDVYWEATLKLLRSNMALAKPGDKQSLDARRDTRSYLKQLYIRWGEQTGGKKWHSEFEKLRQEIIPEFKLAEG